LNASVQSGGSGALFDQVHREAPLLKAAAVRLGLSSVRGIGSDPAARIEELLCRPPAQAPEVHDVLARSAAKQRLTLDEMAALLSVTDPGLQDEMFATARELKKTVYGNRIVLFAPLYIGNKCTNACRYCGFRSDNRDIVRRTLTDDELRAEVLARIGKGHKRLVIDYGEHPDYGAETIAHAVEIIYATKSGAGEIRRVNVNCAPLDVAGYRLMKKVGIGTYQIFQETYHRPTYAAMHPSGNKSDFLWRLYGQDRAMEGGCDDVGLGALFGLYDWRFEALSLLAHAIHLEETFGVGPHTFSFPRLKDASNRDLDPQLVWRGKDDQDWSDLVVHAPPLYIQEKVHPKVLIDDLLRQSKARATATASQPTTVLPPPVGMRRQMYGMPGNCATGGQYLDKTGKYQGFLVNEISGRWQASTELALPGGATQTSHNGGVVSLSCQSPGNCSAGAAYLDAAGRYQAMIVNETGHVWKAASRLALPSNAAGVGIGGGVYALVCQKSGVCDAVGSYLSGATNYSAFTVGAP